jgi:hypothetical protein
LESVCGLGINPLGFSFYFKREVNAGAISDPLQA